MRAQQLLYVLPEGPLCGAEIGVWRGYMSNLLLKRPDMRLYMVDNWKAVPGLEDRGYGEDDQRKNRFLAWKLTDFAHDRRIVLDMDSVSASQFVPDGLLDFVFIDGDHSYAGVAADIEAWLPKLKAGALLCGHDYGNKNDKHGEGVSRAVNEFAEEVDAKVMGGNDHTWFIRI